MAADSSYAPNVYREQGGKRMVVATSGEVQLAGGVVRSTGSGAILGSSGLAIGSTGVITNAGTLTNTGSIANSGTGAISDQVTAITATTTAYSAAIPNYGIATIGTTSARKKVKFAISAPVAGAKVDIFGISTGSTGELGWIVPAAGVSYDSTGNRKLTVVGKTSYVSLRGLSATQWRVVSASTDIVLAGT